MPKKTVEIPLWDFSRGMYTKTPKEMIPIDALSYCANALWDEKNRVSKVWGTSLLLVAADNAFAANPIYNLYNHIEVAGSEVLIIQALNTAVPGVMKLWSLRSDKSSVTDITPAGVTLALNKRINFATHMGMLYAWNGVNDLHCWQGQSTATWRTYHAASKERFTYLATHNYRLWAAHSSQNPIRVIYTGVNEAHFGAYYGDEVDPTTGASYVGNQNYFDFPTADGTPITGICEFQDSLLIFKPYHIFRLLGDPLYGATVKCVSEGVGCFAHDSIAVRADATVLFLAHDGIYAYGDTQMLIDAEDQKAYAGGGTIRLTSNIDDYWSTYFTKPNPLATRMLVKTADVDSASWTLTTCTKRTAPISTYRPDVVTFDLTSGSEEVIAYTDTASISWVNLQSVDTVNGIYDENIFYSQNFTPGRVGAGGRSYGIPNEVDLYLAPNGTLTSTQKLNVFITGTKKDTDSVDIPDMSVIYAEGQKALDTVASTDWVTVSMSYWDFPQSIGGGLATNDRIALVVKPVGDTTSLYAKWAYKGGLGSAQMTNSDKFTPASQSTLDYLFRLNCKNFVTSATVETNAFDASSDASFVSWLNAFINEETKTAHNYVKHHKLVKLEYATSANGSSWGSWTETESGGDISSTDKYVKFKLTYRLRSGASADDGDSFALIGVKAAYSIQAVSEKLVKGIVWDNRYLFASNLADSGG